MYKDHAEKVRDLHEHFCGGLDKLSADVEQKTKTIENDIELEGRKILRLLSKAQNAKLLSILGGTAVSVSALPSAILLCDCGRAAHLPATGPACLACCDRATAIVNNNTGRLSHSLNQRSLPLAQTRGGCRSAGASPVLFQPASCASDAHACKRLNACWFACLRCRWHA